MKAGIANDWRGCESRPTETCNVHCKLTSFFIQLLRFGLFSCIWLWYREGTRRENNSSLQMSCKHSWRCGSPPEGQKGMDEPAFVGIGELSRPSVWVGNNTRKQKNRAESVQAVFVRFIIHLAKFEHSTTSGAQTPETSLFDQCFNLFVFRPNPTNECS